MKVLTLDQSQCFHSQSDFKSPRNPMSMAGPTSHRPWDWLELVCNIRCEKLLCNICCENCNWLHPSDPAEPGASRAYRLDPADRMELDESISKLIEDEIKALPRRSLNHPNQYCLSLWLRWLLNNLRLREYKPLTRVSPPPNLLHACRRMEAWR